MPGHERFLHNALAGLGGIRLLLLVVAADEGVRPQTREHLAIAQLLGIPEAVVALTKLDLVDDELAGLVELEVGELLAGTPWAGAPLFRTSATTGEGVDALAAELVRRARTAAPLPAENAPTRLPIDRAFAPRGQGVVVTGTLARGVLASGDELRLEPAATNVRVRGLQVHGQPAEEVHAGSRVAVQLGGVDLAALERGQELVADEGPEPTRSLLARLRLLPDAPLAIDRPMEVRLHLFAAERPARLRPLAPARLAPGEEGLVVLRTREPLVAVRGDRFVVRRLSPAATLGGGTILDPHWRRPRRSELAARLDALTGGDDDALLAWIDAAAEAGTSETELARRLGERAALTGKRLDELVAQGHTLRAGGRVFAPRRLRAIEFKAKRLLADYFERDRLAEAMPKAELVKKLLPPRAAAQADVHLGWLATRKIVAVEGDRVSLPGRQAELSRDESGLAGKILAEYDAAQLEPPSPLEVSRRLTSKPEMVSGLVRHLVARHRLVHLPGGLIFSAAAIRKMKEDLLASDVDRFAVADFKQRFGLSRKFAIPLLEHLDSSGVTRRIGDQRQVVRSRS